MNSLLDAKSWTPETRTDDDAVDDYRDAVTTKAWTDAAWSAAQSYFDQ